MDEQTKILMAIKEELAEIRTDLKYHIQRTDSLEEQHESFKRYLYMAHGAIALILFAVPLLIKFLA